MNAAADVRYDVGDFSATIGQRFIDQEDPDRLVEFADSLSRRADLQLGTKRDFKKAVLDFFVREVGTLEIPSIASDI